MLRKKPSASNLILGALILTGVVAIVLGWNDWNRNRDQILFSVADPSALLVEPSDDPHAIPFRMANHSATRARIVGANAC